MAVYFRLAHHFKQCHRVAVFIGMKWNARPPHLGAFSFGTLLHAASKVEFASL
jgi:hypothetical protein